MSTASRLSVIMPNFNDERYLRECIGALLRQERPADEIIVVDDASTDGSVAVIEELAAGNPTVSLVRHEANLGVNSACRTGLGAATGDYIVFTSADDRLLPNFFRLGMAMLEEHPEASVSAGANSVLEDDGSVRAVGRCFPPGGYYTPDQFMPYIRGGYWIAGLTAIIDRSVFDAAGGFRDDLHWYADWWVYQLVAFRHGVCIVPEVVGARRVLPTSYSGRAATGDKRRVVARILDDLAGPDYAVDRPRCAAGALVALRSPGLEVIVGHPRFWRWLTWPYLRLVASDVARALAPARARRWYSARSQRQSQRGTNVVQD